MLGNSFSSNYENAKKCVLALKSIQPIQMGNSRLISQEQCLKLLRSLSIRELQDIAQQEKEDKLRFKEQDLMLGKRKSSQRSDIKDDGEQEELEIIKIKKIKKNEVNSQDLSIRNIYQEEEEKKIDNDRNGEQYLSSNNNIQKCYFDQCFSSQLISMIYSNFQRPSSDISTLFNSLTSVVDIFKHLTTIYKNQSIIASESPKIFLECFDDVVKNIILKKDEFVNDIIRYSEELKKFIDYTKIRTEQLYNLLSRVVQQEYRQDVLKFLVEDFSPTLQLFTDICNQLNTENKKEELKKAFQYYVKINHRTSLLKNAVFFAGKIEGGDNLLKEEFQEKLYLLKNQTIDQNESEHISSFLVYMVFKNRPLFEDLFESFQQYSQNVQQQIMDRLSRDNNKAKIKQFLQKPPQQKNQSSSTAPSFLQVLLSTFDYNNSYLLQVFAYNLLVKSETPFIEQAKSQKILEQLKGHVNQTPNIFDFYKSFPEYFEEKVVEEYKNLKELQSTTCAQFKEKYSFLPESKQQSTYLILFKRFLEEDSWFITKENMSEFVTCFTQKLDREELLEYLLQYVTQEKQNLNALLIPFILKVALQTKRLQLEKQEEQVQNIVVEMAQNKVWNVNTTFLNGLKIYFNNLCTPDTKTALFSRITSHFATLPNNKEIIQQFEEIFE